MSNPFYQIAAALLIATVLGFVASRIRQPLIIAFIGVGILVGPGVLNIMPVTGPLDVLASMGVALLLFLVGLRLDVGVFRSAGSSIALAGLAQVTVTALLGTGLAMLLGLSAVTAAYVGAAITFSSTVVIVKTLSDKRELDSLHGRIAIGYLIIQDLVVLIGMVVLSAVGREGQSPAAIAAVIGRGFAGMALLGLAMRFVLPKLTELLCKPPELLVLFAITWALSLAAVADAMGLSRETAAFLAGLSLATSPHRDMLAARLVGLRDFLLLFFFITLGASVDLGEAISQWAVALVLVVFVLAVKPLLLTSILGALGFRRRTAFLTGVSSAQVSEFALIMLGLGASLGHIGSGTRSLVTLVAIATLPASVYGMTYSSRLYERFGHLLKPLEKQKGVREAAAELLDPVAVGGAEVIVYGLGRLGGSVIARLQEREIEVIGFDFNPDEIRLRRSQGEQVYLGDAEDPEFIHFLPLSQVRVVLSTIRLPEANRVLVASLRRRGFEGQVVVAAHSDDEAEDLMGVGADLVLLPFEDAAERAVDVVLAELGRPHEHRRVSEA